MELRKLAICMGFFLIAALQCSEAHTVHRRDADDDLFGDTQADEGTDDETQNDTEFGGDEEPAPEKPPAAIVTPATNYEVDRGTDLRLECKVDPEAGTVVQWIKDKNDLFFGNLKTANGPEYSRYNLVPNSKDLLISQVEPSDSGSYECVILQKVPVSIKHTVVVKTKPEIISFTASNDGNVNEGSNLELTCNVTGVPPPQIVWSRDSENGNERLKEDDGEFSANKLFVKNVKRENAGKYYCYAFNSVGQNQAELRVNVFGKPEVHVHKTIVNSAINVEAVLQCTAHDNGQPHIRWYKDGKLVEDSSSKYSVSTDGAHSNLTVTPSKDQDFGTFTCEAENDHGKHNRSIDLVQEPVVEHLDTDGPKLSWTIHSHQPLEEIEVQVKDVKGESEWRSLTVPLPTIKNHKYDISFSLEDKHLEAGKYEVVVKAKNNHSWSGSTDPAIIEIEALPPYVQRASVYPGGSNAHSIRPATFISLAFTYLLVRLV